MTKSDTPIPKKYYSLSDLARSLSSQIQKAYPASYWITAEISKLNYYPQSGHCYPQLVEKKDGKIIADMRGMIFRRDYGKIRQIFLDVTGKELADGMQILFQCKLSYHPLYSFSLTITNIEPSFTLGEMARLRQEAIKKLKAEGVFNRNKSLYLPMLVQKVAVISVETSKGFMDFKNVLGASPFPDSIKFQLFPALLQGDAAVASITSALTLIKDSQEHFDAVLIIRGGGGETGLDCYDSYTLARNVSLFPIPIITGIGHATNLTVVEQVAYKNLITPTDLARSLIQNFIDFADRLAKIKRSLINFRRVWFKINRDELDIKLEKLHLTVNERLTKDQALIRSSANSIKTGVEEGLHEAKITIDYRHPEALKSLTKSFISNHKRSLELHPGNLEALSKAQLRELKTKLGFIGDKLRILDPVNTLKRGFSITSVNGKPIIDVDEIQPGTEMETRLWKGTVKSITK